MLRQMRRPAPTKAPMQTPITVDNGITDVAPDEVELSLEEWEGTLVVEVEVITRLLLKQRAVVRTVITEAKGERRQTSQAQNWDLQYSMGRQRCWCQGRAWSQTGRPRSENRRYRWPLEGP